MHPIMNRIALGLVASGLVFLAGCSSSPTGAPTPAEVKTAVKAGGAASRRDVKTAIDPDASKISLTPVDTTVEAISKQKPNGQLTGRQGPFETTSWRVNGTIESIRLMKDHDYYMVVKGDNGGQTVVEVPDPNDCKGSPLEPQIAAARKELTDRYHPTSDVKPLHDQATVTGVGFLGFGNGNKKGSKEGRGARLMPGTGFDFGNGK